MRQMEANQFDKDTKRQQKMLKEAKINDSFKEPVNTYETKRRVKNKFDSEDSTTFNGMEYFQRTPLLSPPKPTPSDLLFKTSLRERFQNVDQITSIEVMLLHDKYQKLCDTFKQIDEMLFFLKTKQQPTFLTNIQDQLYENKKLRITQHQIQQILSIFPDAYSLSWNRNEKLIRLDRTDLLIQTSIKTHLQMDDRLRKFKLLMFNYIRCNGEYIAEAALPKLQNNYSTDEERMKFIKQIAETEPKNVLQAKVSTQPTLSRVSQILIDKLRQKQKKELLETEHKAPIKQLITISSLLFIYYRDRNVSNMFYNNVFKYVLDSLKNITETQLKEYLPKLLEICPNWLKLVDNQNGQILRMDKSIDLPLILRAIEDL